MSKLRAAEECCSGVLQTEIMDNVLDDQSSHTPLCSTGGGGGGDEMQNSPRHTELSHCCLQAGPLRQVTTAMERPRCGENIEKKC